MKSPNAKSSFRMLIVDDERDLREEFKSAIMDYFQSIRVESVRDGVEAIKIMHLLKPNLVLVDVNMPGIDGFEVCKRIKSNPIFGNVQIVIMTGMVQQRLFERALEAGAAECLTKPIGFEQLFNIVKKYHQQHFASLPTQSTDSGKV